MFGRRPGRPRSEGLTLAEERVLAHLREGQTNAEIAVRLGVSVNTVRYHVSNLLAKSGLKARGELADWTPSAPGRDRRRPAIALAALAVVGTGAAAGVAVVVVMGIHVLAGNDDRANAADDAAPVETMTAVPTPTRVIPTPELAANRVPEVATVALLEWDSATPNVQLLDVSTGETLARYDTGYGPTVALRRSANEVLVSHVAGSVHVLDILDAADGLSLKTRIPTPDRPIAKVSTGKEWLILSADERYFAYTSSTMRTELPECAQGGDGPSCTRAVVKIIDLDNRDASPFSYELPRHCGLGIYRQHGSSGIAVGCGDGRQFVLDPVGGVESAQGPSRRNEEDPTISRNAANAQLAVESTDGWTGTLVSQGSFVWTRDGEREVNHRAVPPGMMPRWPIFAEVGDGQLVVGYVERSYTQYPEGLAIFNMADGTIEKTLPHYDIGRTMVASGPETLLAVTQDGRLIEIGLVTGAERTLRVVGDDSENFALVR